MDNDLIKRILHKMGRESAKYIGKRTGFLPVEKKILSAGRRAGLADSAVEKESESVGRGWHRKMDGVMKGDLVEKVESRRGRRSEILQELQIPRSTYYKWHRGYEEEGIVGFQKVRLKGRIWN